MRASTIDFSAYDRNATEAERESLRRFDVSKITGGHCRKMREQYEKRKANA